MTPRRGPRRAALFASLAAAGLFLPLLAGTSAQADDRERFGFKVLASPQAAKDKQDAAEEALAAVEEIIDPATPLQVDPLALDDDDANHGKDLTLALRDLAATRADLPKDKRETAARLLARPTDPAPECRTEDAVFGYDFCYGAQPTQKLCNTVACVHWTTQGRHAIPTENDGAGGVYPGAAGGTPDYVEFTLATMRTIANAYVRAGYRRPPSDGGADGTTLPDVYLADLRPAGVFGYCATDEEITTHGPAPSYCVLDNDYLDFGINPRSALRVTAAHEFFHAVQFGYDALEDAWMMEATASWIEDEVFNGINDNRNYLPYGPLGVPHQSLDTFEGLEPYGTWIFFRYLGEKFPTELGGMPVIIRDIWRRAGEAGPDPDTDNVYSVQAIKDVLAARGTAVSTQLALFSMWNQRPSAYYREGSSYRTAPTRRQFNLTNANRTASAATNLSQLATATYRWKRGASLTGAWKVNFAVNLNSRAKGGAAIVTIKRKGKGPLAQILKLDVNGNANVNYAFGPATEWIAITAVNGSTAYAGCNDDDRDQTSTCRGYAVDDPRPQRITARAFK